MTYEEIVEKTRQQVESYDVSKINGHLAIQIDIVGEGEGAFYIELKDGAASVEPYEYFDRDCKFIVSGEDFIAIATGELDAVKAFTVGKLKVEGDIERALEFSKIVEKVKKAAKKSAKEK